MNQVPIRRDWYDKRISRRRTEARPAYYDSGSGQWIDMEDGSVLSSSEIDTLRHYQMKVDYDARIRDVAIPPPGLPRGAGTIFNGIVHWEEFPANQDT